MRNVPAVVTSTANILFRREVIQFLAVPTPLRPFPAIHRHLPALRAGRKRSDRVWASERTRVRTSNPEVAVLLHQACERSGTFPALVQAIDGTDGLVYIASGRCARSTVRACLTHQVTVAGPNRILHIQVDTNRRDLDVMIAIGHELAHAMEVLGEPGISNGQEETDFYRGHAVMMKSVLETYNAIQAGASVGAELRRSTYGDVADAR